MKIREVGRRFLVPSIVVTGVCWMRFGCFVSPRAEVELSSLLRIGRGTRISSFTKVKASRGPLTIGSNVSIGTNCFISSDTGGVEIGDYTMIGPSVTIVANNYTYAKADVPMRMQPTTSRGIVIGSDVWLGARVTVLDGVRIGSGCVVGSGAIIREDLADYTVAVPHQKLMKLPRINT